MTSWTSWTSTIAPGVLQGHWGERFLGAPALMADIVSEGACQAVRASWLLEKTSPDDALALKGEERLMPRYPNETSAQYRARLMAVWETWPYAGSAQAIEAQLAAAGFAAKVVFHPERTGPKGEAAPYWSQFWIQLLGTSDYQTPVWGEAEGDFAWNDGAEWGPTDVRPEDADLIRAIVKKWKPADWICRGFGYAIESEF